MAKTTTLLDVFSTEDNVPLHHMLKKSLPDYAEKYTISMSQDLNERRECLALIPLTRVIDALAKYTGTQYSASRLLAKLKRAQAPRLPQYPTIAEQNKTTDLRKVPTQVSNCQRLQITQQPPGQIRRPPRGTQQRQRPMQDL